MGQNQNALIDATLQEIGALGTGQTASADDRAAVSSRIVPMVADLQARRIFYVGDIEDIDDAAFSWIVMILAQMVGPKFGGAADYKAIMFAEDKLRVLSQTYPINSPVVAHWF